MEIKKKIIHVLSPERSPDIKRLMNKSKLIQLSQISESCTISKCSTLHAGDLTIIQRGPQVNMA